MPPPVSATLTQTPSAPSPVCRVSVPPCGHGLQGVLDQVDQHLLDLRRVNGRDGQFARQAGADVEAAVVYLRLEQFEGLLHDIVERGRLELRHRRPDRVQELGDDVVEAVNLAAGDQEVLFELGDEVAGVAHAGGGLGSGARAGRGAGFASGLSGGGPKLLKFALHELQVNMQGVEGVADLVGDAGREQGQRLNPLALDGFDGLLAGFGIVVEDEGDAGAAGRFAIQRGGVEPKEARAGILDLKLVPHDALAARVVEPANLLPVQLGDEISYRLAFDARAASPRKRVTAWLK